MSTDQKSGSLQNPVQQAVNAWTDIGEKIVKKLESLTVEPPLTQEEVDYFPCFLKQNLLEYKKFYDENLGCLIQQINFDIDAFREPVEDPVAEAIARLTEAINESVELFYKGMTHKASSTFLKAFEDYVLPLLKVKWDGETDSTYELNKGDTFYRARPWKCKQEPCHYGQYKYELFHVPFEKRQIVSTNRFTIPGLPALYLGSSPQLCKTEIDPENSDEIWISKFELKENTRVLQLLGLRQFMSLGNCDTTSVLRFLVMYPLTLACSVRVKHAGGNFKPEYIMPQLLLQFAIESDEVKGVKYMSTLANHDNEDDYNLIFPVKEIKSSGYCTELKKLFDWDNPTKMDNDS